MGSRMRNLIRRRTAQRWLHREALQLAYEAELFGCPAMKSEARSLLRATTSVDRPLTRFA